MFHPILKTSLKLVIAPLILGVAFNAWPMQPITPGQITQEQLDNTDNFTETGIYYDSYTFATEIGNLIYTIAAVSDEFPATVLLVNPHTGETKHLSRVFRPGDYFQFSGVLEEAGQYTIYILSTTDQPFGAYRLALNLAPVGAPADPSADPAVAQCGSSFLDCKAQCNAAHPGGTDVIISCKNVCAQKYMVCLNSGEWP